MYSGEGKCVCVGGGELVSGREKLDLHGRREKSLRCVEKNQRTFAWCYNARLRSCERTFAGVITSVRWFSNVRLRVL